MSKSFNAKYDSVNPFKKHSSKRKNKMTPYNRSKVKGGKYE